MSGSNPPVREIDESSFFRVGGLLFFCWAILAPAPVTTVARLKAVCASAECI